MSEIVSAIVSVIAALVGVLSLILNRLESKARTAKTETETKELKQDLADKATEANTELFERLQLERKNSESKLKEKMKEIADGYDATLKRVNDEFKEYKKQYQTDLRNVNDSLNAERDRSLTRDKELDRYRNAYVENITQINDLKHELENTKSRLSQHDQSIGEIEKKTGGLPERGGVSQK